MSVLSPLLFLAYVNDIWRNTESKIRLFANYCTIYRKTVKNYDAGKLQDWAVENEMKINPNKSKEMCFMRARVKDSLNYILMDHKIPDVYCCKY
jgi:hypothetical protein